MRQFQRLCILDQNTVLGSNAGACHDGRGRGQPKGARAGNHQHGNGVDHSHFKGLTTQQPAQQRDQRNHQHHGNEDSAYLVHQALNRCLGSLRVFDQADDAGQHGVDAGGRHFHDDPAITVQGATCHFVLQGFRHRQWFAREHRFVHLGLAFLHQAIDCKTLTRAHHQLVAHQHFINGHIRFTVQPQQMRGLGSQGVQGANGRGGLPLGPGFQPFAQQHQGDDHGGGFKIKVWQGPGCGT